MCSNLRRTVISRRLCVTYRGVHRRGRPRPGAGSAYRLVGPFTNVLFYTRYNGAINQAALDTDRNGHIHVQYSGVHGYRGSSTSFSLIRGRVIKTLGS